MKNLVGTVAGIVLLVVVVLSIKLCSFTIAENENGIVTQFGKPTGQTITQAGLHFKLPFIQTVNRIDVRMKEWG